ncbi:MAG: hypothetical protein HWN66_16425 [Candidatus Helarchaeota archaeon]|nr:hypothetical protein [Candidatus Helarchaeota archaeon]
MKDKLISFFIICNLIFVSAIWVLLLSPCNFRLYGYPEFSSQSYWRIDIAGFMAGLLSAISLVFYLGYFLDTDVPDRTFLKLGTEIGIPSWFLGIGSEIVVFVYIFRDYQDFDMYFPIVMLLSFIGQAVFGILTIYRRLK